MPSCPVHRLFPRRLPAGTRGRKRAPGRLPAARPAHIWPPPTPLSCPRRPGRRRSPSTEGQKGSWAQLLATAGTTSVWPLTMRVGRPVPPEGATRAIRDSRPGAGSTSAQAGRHGPSASFKMPPSLASSPGGLEVSTAMRAEASSTTRAASTCSRTSRDYPGVALAVARSGPGDAAHLHGCGQVRMGGDHPDGEAVPAGDVAAEAPLPGGHPLVALLAGGAERHAGNLPVGQLVTGGHGAVQQLDGHLVWAQLAEEDLGGDLTGAAEVGDRAGRVRAHRDDGHLLPRVDDAVLPSGQLLGPGVALGAQGLGPFGHGLVHLLHVVPHHAGGLDTWPQAGQRVFHTGDPGPREAVATAVVI